MQLFRVGWRIALLLFIALPCGFFLVLSASYLYLGPKLPPAEQITNVQLQTPLRIYSADDKLIAEYGSKRRIPLTYEQFPKPFIHAVLAAEDDGFFEHGAVDFKGLARAVFQLVRYQEIRSGGSTITMQVARNFFLTLHQTFLRKFNEIVLSIQIEHILTKEQILALYLDKIFYGKHAYGAAAAAQVYYGKPLSELNLAQFAMIAGLPQAPSVHNPIDGPRSSLIRRNWILGRMKKLGYINEQQFQLAAAQPITAKYHGVAPSVNAGYAAELARRQVHELLGDSAYTSGVKVYTTLKSDRQEAAVKAIWSGLQAYDKRHGWRGPLDHIDIKQLPSLSIPTGKQANSDEVSVSAASRAWAKKLATYSETANLKVALVANVGHKDAWVVLKDARQIHLNWDAMSWANPFNNANYRGHAPDEASDVITPGDVVYLLPTGKKDDITTWRVAKIPAIQGALISLDPHTGAIQAIQGGYSFELSKFNRATQAVRQPGSSFKPFIYTAGLEHGLTPATLLNDAPVVFGNNKLGTVWRPEGYTEEFFGPVRLRFALLESLNLATIRLLNRVGIDQTLTTLKQFHLPVKRFPHNLSISLGTVGLTPMQMATAYSTFANGGYHIRPWLIQKITTTKGGLIWKAPEVILCDRTIKPDGSVVLPANSPCPPAESTPDVGITIDSGRELAPLQPQADPKSVEPVYRYRTLNKQVAWLMYSIMQSVITDGTGRRALRLNYPGLAGKTGTTDNEVDAWFSGYSPDVVTTVWTGKDQPSSLGYYEQGALTALPIWIDYMRVALPHPPVHSLPQPDGISTVLISKKTGLRAHPGDSNTMFEYFRNGHIPPYSTSSSQSTQGGGAKGLF